jgi:sigma-B regulation protein RsbU (phosphoserine phosphatase)
MELQAYNDSMKTIFADKDDKDILYRRCGEVIGCAYSVEETKQCGTTSHCDYCDLRISALDSYMNNKFIYKKHFSRPFYNTHNQKVIKHLQFSTNIFHFKNDKYIILLIEDITELTNLKKGLN